MVLNPVIQSIVNRLLGLFKSSDLADLPLWDDMQIGAGRQRTTGANPAQFALWKGGLYSYQFNNGQLRETFFDLQFPHNAKLNQTIRPHIHCSKPDGNAGTVQIAFEYSYNASADHKFIAPLTDTVTFDISAYAADEEFRLDLTPLLPVNQLSQIWVCRLARNGHIGADNYGSPLWIHSFDVHYEIDALGSYSISAKFAP
jgi:hypothetical protein